MTVSVLLLLAFVALALCLMGRQAYRRWTSHRAWVRYRDSQGKDTRPAEEVSPGVFARDDEVLITTGGNPHGNPSEGRPEGSGPEDD